MGSSMDCKNNPCCGDRLSCFGKPKPKFAPEQAGGDVRNRLRAAVLRGTADEVDGKPNGNIITKGCEAAEYCDPEDATGSFVDAVVDEIIAALAPATEGRKS